MHIEKGFYCHYKHDPMGVVGNYMYEVLGVGLHTEDRGYLVVYRPLYQNTFLENANYCLRPYDMFIESVTKDGKTFPRFQKITDTEIIAKLEQIRDTMYK